MRNKLIVTMALCLLVQGCAMQKPSTAAAPLPPGITGAADASFNSAVMALHGALVAGEAYRAQHPDALPAAYVADFNLFVTGVNIVDATFVSYQQGAATQAQMTAALANASAQQTKLFADVTGAIK